MSTTSNRHAGTGAGGAQAADPRAHLRGAGAHPAASGPRRQPLYLSRKRPGFPFGSLMPYALDSAGRPLFLISTMAMHTQNLQQDARASLLVTQPEAEGDPLGAARVTVVGNAATLAAPEVAEARGLYLERHPNSKYWVDFDDFSFFRMEVVDVYYVGGFGVMGWVAAPEYADAHADPLGGCGRRDPEAYERRSPGCADPAGKSICRDHGSGGGDDCSGSPRLSRAHENRRRHEGCTHSFPG